MSELKSELVDLVRKYEQKGIVLYRVLVERGESGEVLNVKLVFEEKEG